MTEQMLNNLMLTSLRSEMPLALADLVRLAGAPSTTFLPELLQEQRVVDQMELMAEESLM